MPKDYLIIGAGALVAWLLVSRRMSPEEAAASGTVRFVKTLISWCVVGGVVWFAWWALSTRCNGAS